MCFFIPQTSMNILSHNVPKRGKYERKIWKVDCCEISELTFMLLHCFRSNRMVIFDMSFPAFPQCKRFLAVAALIRSERFKNLIFWLPFGCSTNLQTFHWDARGWRVSVSALHTRTSCRNARIQPSSPCVLIECATEAAAFYERFFHRTRRPVPEKQGREAVTGGRK